MADIHTLYGAPASLYTGKARSYLIKLGVPYREMGTRTDHHREHVRPRAGSHTIPALETVDGDVIRDSTAIIDHFEAELGDPAQPRTPVQRVVARLFDVIGSEGLLRPAMHYRWNFDDTNVEFIRINFGMIMGADPTPFMDRMRAGARAFGVHPDTYAIVEELYDEFLAVADAHFKDVPYLLGGKPSIGDFGMIAPLYAHLGRDPKPLALMQQRAPYLFRWVERMNRPDPDTPEFGEVALEFLPNDEIPETLVALLELMATDFVPETLAAAECINAWLADQNDLAPGTPVQRGVGLGQFEVRGQKLAAMAQPYRFYLLKRVQDEYAALDPAGRAAVEQLFDRTGLRPVLNATVDRDIGRADNLEVWR